MRTEEERKAKNRTNSHIRYLAHREEEKTRSRTYAQTHPEQQKAKHRAYYLANLQKAKAYDLAYDQTLRAEAQQFLGSICACPGCGVSEPLFLTIDHINGRPKGPRRDARLEARDSGWDKTKFQMLCWNCNYIKRDHGFCRVHQTAPENKNGYKPGAQQTLWSLGTD